MKQSKNQEITLINSYRTWLEKKNKNQTAEEEEELKNWMQSLTASALWDSSMESETEWDLLKLEPETALLLFFEDEDLFLKET